MSIMYKFKYLLANEKDKQWGLTVSTVGFDDIKAGDDYPTPGHADGYYFHKETGRILDEFQLLYIAEGKGIFKSSHQKEVELNEGDMFLLFPGEWHTYYPNPVIGWKSYWIGFKGKNINDRLEAGFISKEKPIYHVGYSAAIIWLYEEALKVAHEEPPYMQQILAGQVNHLVGMMYALKHTNELGKSTVRLDMMNRAKKHIRESLESSLTIQQVAERLGMSYSNFRKQFKEYTGLSPATYQQDLKLQRAKELLCTTNMSIKEIAYRLNFDSPDYFSAKFKTKTGRKPSDLRPKRSRT